MRLLESLTVVVGVGEGLASWGVICDHCGPGHTCRERIGAPRTRLPVSPAGFEPAHPRRGRGIHDAAGGSGWCRSEPINAVWGGRMPGCFTRRGDSDDVGAVVGPSEHRPHRGLDRRPVQDADADRRRRRCTRRRRPGCPLRGHGRSVGMDLGIGKRHAARMRCAVGSHRQRTTRRSSHPLATEDCCRSTASPGRNAHAAEYITVVKTAASMRFGDLGPTRTPQLPLGAEARQAVSATLEALDS